MESPLEQTGTQAITPDDVDKPIMVKVEDVSMVFNMASEQFTNLKEYALALAKRELHFKEFRALDHISFEVRKGDVFGIMGTNGSGKSTMLKIIAGVLEPTTGLCEVNGNIAPLIELGAGFDMELTARENVYLNGALLGYSKEFISEHFDEIVDFAEVRDFLDIPMKNYSSGMISRIAFAIATVIVPEILVCDEVLSVGDFMFQKKCENRIRQLIDEHGVTVLIVSHSNEQIARLCNRAIWIEKGETKFLGSAAEVCRRYSGIGGRTGSKEAELAISEKLKSISSFNSVPRKICAENPFELMTMTALELPDNTYSNTVIIFPVTTHINALFAAQFAHGLNAFVLSCNADGIPISTLQVLNMRRPRSIYLVDCGREATVAKLSLERLPWHPEIIDLSGSGNPAEYSVELLEYGTQHNLFGQTAVVLDFDDEIEAYALAPFIRASRCPVLFIWSHNPEFSKITFDRASAILQDSDIRTIIVAGNTLPESYITPLQKCFNIKNLAREKTNTFNSVNQIVEFLLSKQTSNRTCLFVSSCDSSQRMYLPAICNGIQEPDALLLIDSLDMDYFVSAMELVEKNSDKIRSIIFFGSCNAFLDVDCQLLLHSLQK